MISCITQYTVPAASTSQFILKEINGQTGEKIISKCKGHKAESEVRLLIGHIKVHLVDIRDYHIVDPNKYSPISKEKLVVLLKEATNLVSMDIEIEVETISKKVIQIDANVTVNDFIMNPTDEKIKPLFRELMALEGAFWLYISIRDKAQDIPLLHTSR